MLLQYVGELTNQGVPGVACVERQSDSWPHDFAIAIMRGAYATVYAPYFAYPRCWKDNWAQADPAAAAARRHQIRQRQLRQRLLPHPQKNDVVVVPLRRERG